jgi:hypothetical protein
VLELPPGTHRLKFIVDDEWKCSNEMETATDPDGNLVNYLQVMDEEEENENDDFGDNDLSTVSSSGSLSNDGKKYSNIIPPELLQLASVSDEIQKSDWEKKQPQPPTLPPHLEKVLLNSNTVSEEDNSVLHVPNHVTLNHLYACSIKDNVMALATTSRYRKKVKRFTKDRTNKYILTLSIIVCNYHVLSSCISQELNYMYSLYTNYSL